MNSRCRPKSRPRKFPVIRPRLEAMEDRVVLSASITAGGLEFLAASGFTASGAVDSASGQVDVGFAPQSGQKFQPLLSLRGGASVDTSALTFSDSGSVVATIAGTPGDASSPARSRSTSPACWDQASAACRGRA